MAKIHASRKFFFVLMTSVLLAACAPAVDAGQVATQAAATVAARYEATLAAGRTAEAARLASTLDVQSTQIAGLQTAQAAPTITLPPAPTATQAAGSPAIQTASGDKCELVSQHPIDGTRFPLAWTTGADPWYWDVKNTGTTTWTKEYLYRYFSGRQMTSADSYKLTRDVPPGQVARLTISPLLPKTPGEWTTTWVLTNPAGGNFCSFFVTARTTDSLKEPVYTNTPDTESWLCSDPDRSRRAGYNCFYFCNSAERTDACFLEGTPVPKP